jgi:hypothetical protein
MQNKYVLNENIKHNNNVHGLYAFEVKQYSENIKKSENIFIYIRI